MQYVYVPTPEEEDLIVQKSMDAISILKELPYDAMVIYALYQMVCSFEDASGAKIVKEWAMKENTLD